MVQRSDSVCRKPRLFQFIARMRLLGETEHSVLEGEDSGYTSS